jgi:hypothetical protein
MNKFKCVVRHRTGHHGHAHDLPRAHLREDCRWFSEVRTSGKVRGSMARSRGKLAELLAVVLLAICSWPARAAVQETAAASEYQVEAGFLYQFAKFVKWPAGVFADGKSPITIGILGEDPFGDALEATVRNKTIDNRSFRIVHLDMKSLAEAKRCQLLFICPSEKRVSEVLDSLQNSSVLTVSKQDRFIEAGGMINFFVEDKKVEFEINNERAQRAGLKISAKLLNLARHKGAG